MLSPVFSEMHHYNTHLGLQELNRDSTPPFPQIRHFHYKIMRITITDTPHRDLSTHDLECPASPARIIFSLSRIIVFRFFHVFTHIYVGNIQLSTHVFVY